MVQCYVSIDNSDDKLSQGEWHSFCTTLEDVIHNYSTWIYGKWYSASNSIWQNMCISFEIEEMMNTFKERLGILASRYRQDAIALSIVEKTLMVREYQGLNT